MDEAQYDAAISLSVKVSRDTELAQALKLATQIDQLSTDIANEAKNRVRHLPAELQHIILDAVSRKLA